MKILVVGVGYVGKALTELFASKNDVYAFDVDPTKYRGRKPIVHIASSLEEGAKDADFVFLCLPTDYDPSTGKFDVSAIEETMAKLRGSDAIIVLKSTVPVGYTASLLSRYPGQKIIFNPEFLRESKAIEDAKDPSRIVIGGELESAYALAGLYLHCVQKEDVQIRVTGLEEAESAKLFSNAYLALRVSFFNELDTYAASKGLNSKDIIDCVCLDPRIGNHYNNPSFGYGGYCLPKDTKQLLSAYEGIPEDLISATIRSNQTRKEFIVEEVSKTLSRQEKPILGIYRLTMKKGSDNFRQSAVLDIMKSLQKRGYFMNIYEPMIHEPTFLGIPVISDLEAFKKEATLILANRIDEGIEDVADKVFTRDIFSKDE